MEILSFIISNGKNILVFYAIYQIFKNIFSLSPKNQFMIYFGMTVSSILIFVSFQKIIPKNETITWKSIINLILGNNYLLENGDYTILLLSLLLIPIGVLLVSQMIIPLIFNRSAKINNNIRTKLQ